MDKTYQDIHIKIKDAEVFTIREIEILEMFKHPSYFIITGRQGSIREYKVIIPILPYMQFIID